MYQNKETYQARKAAGLCTNCGLRPKLDTTIICSVCRDSKKRAMLEWRSRKRAEGLCSRCNSRPPRTQGQYCDPCLAAHTSNGATLRNTRRSIILEHYGGKCTCCGETNNKYLQLDHINNDGAHQRRTYGYGTSSNCHLWIITHNFPPDFQILCANCHQAKTHFGGCDPHA